MLKEFLYSDIDNKSVIEDVTSIAIMIGEDPSIACESDANVEATKKKFKDRVAGIISRIRDFIRKVVAWIKGKLFKLFNVDTFQINRNKWDDGQNILTMIDKADIGKARTFIIDLKKDLMKYEDIKQQLTLKVDGVFDDASYKRFIKNEYSTDNMIQVSAKSLKKQSVKFKSSLTDLEETAKGFQTLTDSSNYGESASKHGHYSFITNINIRCMNARIMVMNHFMADAGVSSDKMESDKSHMKNDTNKDGQFLTETFKKSVTNKNIEDIRTCIVESIYNDPTFSMKKYDARIKYVKEAGIELNVPYKKRPDEFKLSEDKWDDRYFYRQVEWLRLNFAPDERIPYIKQIGRKVFKMKNHHN